MSEKEAAPETTTQERKRMATMAGLLVAFSVWGFLIFLAWKISVRDSVGNQLAQSDRPELPEWMSNTWADALYRQITLGGGTPVLLGDLASVVSSVESSSWIQAVRAVRRDFRGRFEIDVDIQKPICLIRSGGKTLGFSNLAGKRMSLLIPEEMGGDQLLDGDGQKYRPPVVDCTKILEVDERFHAWLLSTVQFADEWQDNLKIAERVRLLEIHPAIYETKRGEKACILECLAWDRQGEKPFKVSWGMNTREVNALENLSNAQKWERLETLIAQTRGPLRDTELIFNSTL